MDLSSLTSERCSDGEVSEERVSPSSGTIVNNEESAEESEEPIDSPIVRKKRVKQFSDSDSDSQAEVINVPVYKDAQNTPDKSNNLETDDDLINDKNNSKKLSYQSRLRSICSDSDSKDEDEEMSSKHEESRISNKRNKLRDKFKNFHSSRLKESTQKKSTDLDENSAKSDKSDEDISSVGKIKQIIQEKTYLKSTLYDHDTSDEESTAPKLVIKQKNARKSTKLISPKPIRMSAKQAMENMQKIKSESNRMLREKDVSLPYHRPKALSLKDIMSRRRPALSSDGKILPIKMNEEQLRQYALQLEQRQKEMMELCKSDSEDEANENEVHENKEDANENEVHENKGEATENEVHENENKANENEGTEKYDDISLVNDSMYDDLVKVNESIINEVTPSSITHANHNETSVGLADVSDVNNDANLIIETDRIEDPESASSITFNKESLNEQGNIVHDNSLNTEQTTTEGDVSAEMKLMYNDSVEDNNMNETEIDTDADKNCEKMGHFTKEEVKLCTEKDSQLISLNHDTETSTTGPILNKTDSIDCDVRDKLSDSVEISNEDVPDVSDDFPDDDLNMDDIDNLIENAEILSQNEINKFNSPMLIRDAQNLKTKPKLTGAPGMVIDLDGTDPLIPKKLSGVELLKERFTFFSKLKTPEEKAKENERRIKPGLQHLKLKHELEEKIAEQRSLEWAKRLEEERQQHQEMDVIRGDGSDVEDDIDKIEAKLADNDQDREEKEHSTESEEEEEEEDDIIVKEKPRIKNPMIADEAEESDCDDVDETEQNGIDGNETNISGQEDADDEQDDNESEEESSEGESEEENQSKPKKGRILKAFEDSDDEDTPVKKVSEENNDIPVDNQLVGKEDVSPPIKYTQDDELQLAQRHKSCSEDLFASQESANLVNSVQTLSDDLGTQTFSILNNDTAEPSIMDMPVPNSLDLKEVRDTQSYEGEDLDHVVGMCSGSFSQNLVTSQFKSTQPTQDLGEDVLALCTGKFYDNQFVSQIDSESRNSGSQDINDLTAIKDTNIAETDKDVGNNVDLKAKDSPVGLDMENQLKCDKNIHDPKPKDHNLLNSLLDELNDPEFETQKPKKYFGDDDANNKENNLDNANTQQKKRLIIDSDDEVNDVDNTDRKLKKKFKKKKMEKRALQISDDEEEQDCDDYDEMSEIEDGDEERIVEYDSEENEVVVQPDQLQNRKKKRKTTDFFEQEAELTSEDEWVGSGDEDEAGLDRLEREAGDDDTFNQRQLQRELGQIHMRDVLDQDKREVRLIQELLFEDGDLGGGGRQRKFRWKNADGDEEGGTSYHEFDTQEDEFESEEQWRKQRHEREMFIKQLKDSGKEDLNTSADSSSLMKTELSETNISIKQSIEIETLEPEKKTAKDIPSPKKSFVLFQQNYHSSLLTRGRGALARLASLAIPLAADDDTPKPGSLAPSSKRNFVFAAVTPKEKPKVSKRKAETNVGTPKLVKKMKIEDNKNHPKNSLLDHFKP